MKISGKCLCGKVDFIADTEPEVGICHCKMCRRWGGGLPLAGLYGKVSLNSEETLTWWKSSPWGERGFCRECGSSLFWRSPGDTEWGVSVGALEDESALKLSRHIHVDGESFYSFSDNTPRETGVESTARIMRELSGQVSADVLAEVLGQMRAYSGDVFADKVEQLLNTTK